MNQASETAKEFIKRKNDAWKAAQVKQETVKFKDIGRKGKHAFLREAWIFMPQTNLSENKVFVIERLRKESIEGKTVYKDFFKKGEIEYRIGYYIRGNIGNKKDRWTWGQFCPLIPKEDLDKLLAKAKKEEIFI